MLDRPIAFLATRDPDAARTFYEQTLGLVFVADEPFALVFAVGTTQLRIQKVEELAPPPYTSFGWSVIDIEATVAELSDRGIRFERFDGFPQDDLGIWEAPGGARVAWFKDPDGNLLSITE